MKKLFLVLAIMMSFLMCSSDIISAKGNNINSTGIQYDFNEWVEYVQIDGQWYKITHLEDGGQIIQAVMGTGE